MKKLLALLAISLLTLPLAQAQDLVAYRLFRGDGSLSNFETMTREAASAEVVLFGELHNNAIAHWLQYELSLALLEKGQPLVLGAEMLESDNQAALNAYLSDSIDQKALDTLARLWHNHPTDYKPLVDLARDSALPFIATNTPRRFARQVYHKGFAALDSLSREEREWLPPLPIAYDPELPGYVAMLDMMQGHGGENLPKAQAIKDATMAYFIYQNLGEGVFLHFNGDYHSANYEGINWYLKKMEGELAIMTISTVTQAELSSLAEEHLGRADFIVVVDEDMTNTY